MLKARGEEPSMRMTVIFQQFTVLHRRAAG